MTYFLGHVLFKASPLIKPFLTPGGWQELKCVCCKVSVGVKCVCTSRTDSLLNLSPLYTHVSGKVIFSRKFYGRMIVVNVNYSFKIFPHF